jgi:predicted tellurium resistance membrane protein TerC
LLVREEGHLFGTLLLLVVVAIVAADIAFAVDSIPGGLRGHPRRRGDLERERVRPPRALGSLLAIVEILVRRFRYVDETIALILALAFVGIKILAADLVDISDLVSLAVIAALLAGVVVASLIADRVDPPHPAAEATRRPPRCPRKLAPRARPPSSRTVPR